jgi:apolipoprotein N-acyltransferase
MRLIVWPESAPADVANNLVPYLDNLYREARAHHSALVMGVLRAESVPAGKGGEGSEDETRYFNSVLAMDDTVSWYDKHHLVPFAEFFPVPHFVRSWLRLMSLPYSDFTPGAAEQPPLAAAHLQLGATICYEDAYGSTMLAVLPRADALVNVTNDAWFGRSTARHQHFQIVRMRALEAGRYLVRAANDGISAVVGPHGEVVARAPEFVPVVLVSKIVPLQGLTPYAVVGNWLVISLALLALAYGLWLRQCRDRPGVEPSP